jgi:hypothetical protein
MRNQDACPSASDLPSQRGFQSLACEILAQSAQIPIVRLKTWFSLFEIHTDSTHSTKEMVEWVVGLQPNVACEFKRAGFLEWRRDWNLAADWAGARQ